MNTTTITGSIALLAIAWSVKRWNKKIGTRKEMAAALVSSVQCSWGS